jgi:flagellar P-ring protein FlgI
VSGAGAAAGGSKVQINHLSVGRIPDGATVERAVPTALGQGDYIHLELNKTDFTTAMRLADVINHEQAADAEIAAALDGRTIQVKAPYGSARVAFIARLENMQVDPGQASARITINARTGSVVMNQAVSLENCSVSHGNLTVVINTETAVSQPNPLAAGTTVATTQSTIDIQSDKGAILVLKKGVSLNEVVRALNSIGATPQDLLAILQAMKSAGALHAELEVI